MAANVGKLNVLVGANISGLQKSLGAASKSISGFAKRVGSFGANVATNITKFAAGAAAVGAGALTVGLVKASHAMDDIGKKADTLGIGTEELVKLRHAGNLAGVGAEELDTGLGKMLKVIGEAATGVPAATDAIEGLGLSVSDLQGLSADQQFGKIADAINSFNDPAQRAAAAANIFGRGFMQMMPLLGAGSAGIKTAGDEAQRLGMTFSRLDASKVEGMNDAFTKLTSSLEGVFQKIVVQIAPTLETAFSAGSLAVADLGQSLAKFVGDGVNDILFFASTWNKQWELIKLNAKLTFQQIKKDSADAAIIKPGKIWDWLTGREQPLGPSQDEIKLQVLLRDLTALREQWERIREAKANPAMDEYTQFFKNFKGALDAADESAFFGPSSSRVELILGRATKVLDLAKDESAFFQDMPMTASGGPIMQFAAAAQAGTTEAASAIFAGMSAKAGTDESIEKHTADTAKNTARIADAIGNLQLVEAF